MFEARLSASARHQKWQHGPEMTHSNHARITVKSSGWANAALEVANEFNHKGFDHRILKDPEGEVELMKLARQAAPGLLVATSGYGDGKVPSGVARTSDFLLPYFNGTSVGAIPSASRR